MKKCSNSKCPNKNPQPKENFLKDIRNADKLQSQCKTCKYAANKRWEAANKDKIAAYERSPERIARHKQTTYAWREKNKEKYNAYMRKKNKEAYPWSRFRRYGITKEWFDETLAKQKGVCAIPGCGRSATKKRCLAVDHVHSTGKVRGILCYKCNRDMNVVDNPEHLSKLLEYKKEFE